MEWKDVLPVLNKDKRQHGCGAGCPRVVVAAALRSVLRWRCRPMFKERWGLGTGLGRLLMSEKG
jgi:hypothetical protein